MAKEKKFYYIVFTPTQADGSLVKDPDVAVKEESFFIAQGGLTQDWGKHWIRVSSDALRKAVHTMNLIEDPSTPDIYGQRSND